MATYSRVSSQRLATCHNDLQLIFNTVIERGYDHSILCGHRDKQMQNIALKKGLSQLAWPDSKHNKKPSMAVDAGPYFSELRNTDWNDEKAFSKFAGYVCAIADELLKAGKIKHKLRWGGDWDSDGRTSDERFVDLPHFELVAI